MSDNSNCPIYKKHHNVIDGVYMLRLPNDWEEIPFIEHADALDEEGELQSLFNDCVIYDIEELKDFHLPFNDVPIVETIFIIRRKGEYFLCETQGDTFVKFSVNISNVQFVKLKDRYDKISKLKENLILK